MQTLRVLVQGVIMVLVVPLQVQGFLPPIMPRGSRWTNHANVNKVNDKSLSATAAGVEQEPPNTINVMAAYDCDSQGREWQQRGALNKAVRAFSQAAVYHPTPERQFRLGVALAENGEPSAAIRAYETALETTSDPVLRHDTHLKLAQLWANDLGTVQAGIQQVDAAMEEFTDSAAALDQKALFVASQGQLEEAIRLWDAALSSGQDMGHGVDDDARFFRAVAKALLGHEADFDGLPNERQYMIDSFWYIHDYYSKQQQHASTNWHSCLFSGTHFSLANALSKARPDGLVCEFGVFHGKSIRLLATMVGDGQVVDGFDTFEGIPEDWGDDYAAGSYTAAAELPERVPNNVQFHVGLFADTLPGYVASLPPAQQLPVRFINVDCDLYQGTVEILHYLASRIGPGTVIVFDEYLMHPTWPEDEYRAFQEACTKFGWEYEYLSFSLFSKQAAVRITKSDSFMGVAAMAN